jgi:hypothetical protein
VSIMVETITRFLLTMLVSIAPSVRSSIHQRLCSRIIMSVHLKVVTCSSDHAALNTELLACNIYHVKKSVILILFKVQSEKSSSNRNEYQEYFLGVKAACA